MILTIEGCTNVK